MKKIIEYVPIITVCLIYFGFCNLDYFYREFNIDVYHYISNTEILLSFLPTVVIIASSLYVFAYSKLVNLPDLVNNEEKIESIGMVERENKAKVEKKTWPFLSSIPFQLLILISIESVINFVLTNYFDYKSYELQELKVFYVVIFFAYFYYSTSLFKNQKLINDNTLLITFISVIYLGMQIGIYRKLDADKIKDGISNKKIEFEYNGKKISSSKQYIYIGQTQSHLFMYNMKNKSTSIYKTENIELLIVK